MMIAVDRPMLTVLMRCFIEIPVHLQRAELFDYDSHPGIVIFIDHLIGIGKLSHVDARNS
jgi:hypothetical protein